MLTVQRLIDAGVFGLHAVAGQGGATRLITWAHAVDLPDPWRWISPGDLVMTTGVGIPLKGRDQIAWLTQLIGSKASALVIAPRPHAPSLSRQMLNAADLLHFPILRASFELEFVKLSHYVIESVLDAQRDRLHASERLFQTYADALRKAPDMAGRLAILARTLKWNVAIEDEVSGIDVFAARPFTEHIDESIERVAIPGRARARLAIVRTTGKTPDDSILVRSLVGLLGVELERLMIHRDQQREEGAILLQDMLESERQWTLARPNLERRGLGGALVSLVIRAGREGRWHAANIHHAPQLISVAPLWLEDKGLLLVISPDNAAAFDFLLSSLGDGTVIGISRPVSAATGIRESFRQARLALAHAAELRVGRLRYGEAETGWLMAPRSLSEARALVGQYLGPLMEYDKAQGTVLLRTLTQFLENDGNWKGTAFDLNIHRQTLVYRLKVIEQLTGIRPTTTQGITLFWTALQAGEQAGLLRQ